jgi:hypothetical protein
MYDSDFIIFWGQMQPEANTPHSKSHSKKTAQKEIITRRFVCFSLSRKIVSFPHCYKSVIKSKLTFFLTISVIMKHDGYN